MTQIFRAANFVRELETEDFRVLTAIELGSRRFSYVPLEQISFYCRYPRPETQFRLDRLHKFGLLQRNSQLGYTGYQLIFESYDVLALHALVEKNIITAVGSPIGKGKESDVFFGQGSDGNEIALKIHRIGRTSFRKVRKLRNYVKDRKHISWLYISRLSAESEFTALKRIEPLHLETPTPIAQNRHIVAMGLIDGQELSTIPELENPREILNEILMQVERFFLEAHMIHCDLCEFNILINPENKIRIIDWPQWEEATHPNAQSYLTRDLINIQTFFKKNYNTTFEIDEVLRTCKVID
ncbi:MAG: serine/threonine-protein kinase RIO2 [Promethearchaeota archaeon]